MSRFGLGFLAHGEGNDQYTKILLHMDGTNGGTSFPDVNAGGSAHTWTAHSATTVTSGQKFGTAIMQSPYIDAPAHADFNLGSGDWAIDFWFDTLAAGNGTSRFMCGQLSNGGAAATYSFSAGLTSANKLIGAVGIVAGAPIFIGGNTAITASGLHHVQLSKTSGVLQLYLDGAKDTSDVAHSGSVPNSPYNFAIGRAGETTTDPFSGLIDEFRLSVGTPRNTANFTPPTSAYS